MKLHLLFTGMLAMVTQVSAQPNHVSWNSWDSTTSRGAFGEDTRAEAGTKWEYRDFMRATATAFNQNQINGEKIYASTLRENLKYEFNNSRFDPSVRFLDQPAGGFCTGFLIAPDILVTAGHCLTSEEDLKSSIWVFDYTSQVPFDKRTHQLTVPVANQYRGVEFLDRDLSDDRKYDYAIIRLDRKVTGRKPYKIRTGGQVDFDDLIAMIGSPSGLPLKIADSAHITNIQPQTFFQTDLDAFHGNSGGPVFNMNGFIEGILVRGYGKDFHVDDDCNCIKPDIWYDENYANGMQSRMGNQVHRIVETNKSVLLQALYRNFEVAIADNNLAEFNDWGSVYPWIWDHIPPGKENLIVLAAKLQRTEFFKIIFSSEDLNLNKVSSLSGIPVLHYLADYNQYEGIQLAHQKYGDKLDLNIRTEAGLTPLMHAAASGSMDAVKTLVRAGANPNIKDNSGKRNARWFAKKWHHKEIVKYLKKAEKGKIQ